MSDTDQNTATEKSGRRNRKSGQRNQKPDRKPEAEATIEAAAEIAAPADTPAPANIAAPADTAAPADIAAPDTTALGDAAPVSFQTIANAYGDYTRKSLEETRSFVEKLGGVRSLDKAMEVQSDFAKQVFDTLVAESQRIRGLHRELARQTFKPLEELVAKASQPGR
jgi:phasin family protein